MKDRKLGHLLARGGLVVLIVTMGFLLAWLLHSLLGRDNPTSTREWISAIQATSAIVVAAATVVLVLVTYLYVRLTRDMVDLQSDYLSPARAQRREEAALAVADLLVMRVEALSTAREAFPLDETAPPNITKVRGWTEMSEIRTTLSRLQTSLPKQLAQACADAMNGCVQARDAQLALYESMRRASMNTISLPTYQDYTWDDCRGVNETLIDAGEIKRFDWADLVSGRYVIEAIENVVRLSDEVGHYLTTDE